MSMMGMLGKVAMGIMVAKTVGSAMGGSGKIGDMLGGLMGGNKTTTGNNNQPSGGLGDLFNSLTGGAQNNTTSNSNNGGLGDLLSSAFTGNEVKAEPNQEKQAEIILKAMINAAKADGEIDAQEQQKITEHIGDISPQEIEFVKSEMQSPLDLQGVIDSVPEGMEQQVYLMSLLTINLDSKPEAVYLDTLRKGLKISEEIANNIHDKLGAQKLYS